MFQQVEVGRRPLFLFAPAGATQPGDTVKDILARLPLALPMTGTGLRHATDDLFAAPDPIPRTIECGSIPVLIRLVIDGTCCAIIPGGAHPRKDPRVRIFQLPNASLITSLIWTHAKADSAQVALIRSLVSRQKFR
jgi:DNA-binding transcriptional LysR family regulator